MREPAFGDLDLCSGAARAVGNELAAIGFNLNNRRVNTEAESPAWRVCDVRVGRAR
jgi:hypothetical protein